MGENGASKAAIEAFLYEEARLLDDGEYEAWVDLFTDDGILWIPCNKPDVDPARELNLAYDTKARLRERVDRIRSEFFWSQEPASRTCRLVSNITLKEPADGDDCMVESRFVLMELRRHKQNLFGGTNRHRLVRSGEGWKIREKLVRLINNDEALGNLTFIVG